MNHVRKLGTLLLVFSAACGARGASGPADPEAVASASQALTSTALIPVGDSTGDSGAKEVWTRCAFGGTSFLAVWSDERDGVFRLRGARVSTSGQLLDSKSLVLVASPGVIDNGNRPEVGSNGRGYLLAWNGPTMQAVRLDMDATPLDTPPLSVGPTALERPAIASNGSDYLVVWLGANPGSGPPNAIFGARVTASGQVLDPGGFLVSTDTSSPPESDFHVAWTGTAYEVVWLDQSTAGGTIRAARVSAQGGVVGGPVDWVAATGSSSLPNSLGNVACSPGGACLLGYGAGATDAWQLFDSSGRLLATPTMLGQVADFAWDGRSFTSIWLGDGNGTTLFAQSIGPGPSLIGSPDTVAAARVNGYYEPALACDGQGHCLTIFMDQPSVMAPTEDRVVGYVLGGDVADSGAWPEASVLASDAAAAGDAAGVRGGPAPDGGVATGSADGGTAAADDGGGSGAGPGNGDDASSGSGRAGSSGGCGCRAEGISGAAGAGGGLWALGIAVLARRRRAVRPQRGDAARL